MNATVAKLFRDKFGEDDAAARLDAAAVDDDERSSRIDQLTQCGRARCQIAWLLASECVLDEFTSLAARHLARRVAAGVAAYVSRRASRPTSRRTTCSASSARRCTRTSWPS